MNHLYSHLTLGFLFFFFSQTPDTGRLIVAIVLPFCPFVEIGQQQHKPKEDLNMNGGRCMEGASYERAVDVLIENVFEKSGYHVRFNKFIILFFTINFCYLNIIFSMS